MLLGDIDAVHARLFDAEELDRPPEPRVGQAGAPVPAEHAVGLAQVGKAHHRFLRTVGNVVLVFLFDKAGGRVQQHAQLVALFLQQILDLEFKRAVHILGVAELLAVQENVRHGIDALKAQQHRVALEQRLVRRKLCFVFIVVIHPLQRLGEIVAPEGIVHLSVLHQIMVDRARHGRRQEFFPSRLPHLPAAVNFRCDHKNDCSFTLRVLVSHYKTHQKEL